MNILNDKAGYVTKEHIVNCGFEVFKTLEGSDMGQMTFSLPQYKNKKCKILGGYWNYIIQDHKGKKLWEGWWNSNEEFDKTMLELNLLKDG